MDELWQLYDEQGRVLTNQGANKDDTFSKALLHGAAHVWIWRRIDNTIEILLQKRAPNKRTWPNLYDISAAGRIDLNEEPLAAALRETKEEIGIDVDGKDLKLVGVHRSYRLVSGDDIENEFQWLYLLRLNGIEKFTLQKTEVASLEWKPITNFEDEVKNSVDQYVPHDNSYYQTVISAIKSDAKI